MKLPRASGILLHPTSFPGPDGIGDLGPEAYQWVDFLHQSGTKLWQVLPLGPTSYGDSPYQCFSAFAGNTYLISPTLLLDLGLLSKTDLADRHLFSEKKINFGTTINWKITLLQRAYQHFQHKKNPSLHNRFNRFQSDNATWLKDYSLFMAIKDNQENQSWLKWAKPLKLREKSAIQQFTSENQTAILEHAFRQFLFFEQWNQLKSYANSNGVCIIGDVPIFVSMDSADAWVNRALFYTDSNGNPTSIAGVPPDYFSPTGQLWGNPLYNWKTHQESGFSWWLERMRASFSMFDWVRLDHFRGFSACWKIPAGNLTAEKGMWEKCPGTALFTALQTELGDLPIIAEDLGVITPDVVEMREAFSFPGMGVLQFAFSSDPADRFLPHNYNQEMVVYTGTHDNNTSLGWFQSISQAEQEYCLRYLACEPDQIPEVMIRTIWSSVASFAIAPMQDFLHLGSEARMNYPSTSEGNWGWRMPLNACSNHLCSQIKELNSLYYR